MNRFNSKIRYLSDASYYVYIIHVPIIILFQGVTSSLEINHFIKFILNFFGGEEPESVLFDTISRHFILVSTPPLNFHGVSLVSSHPIYLDSHYGHSRQNPPFRSRSFGGTPEGR